MIERLLEADRLLALGMDEQAERIYWQAAEVDPRNAIAIVGLARVASDRGDDRTALQFAHKALEIDPENPAAIRLSARLEEIIRYREEADLEMTEVPTTEPPAPGSRRPMAVASEPPLPPAPVLPPPVTLPPMPAAAPPSRSTQRTPPKRGLLRRLMGGR
jgi:tetratricopeptide (TPR) repeat protein